MVNIAELQSQNAKFVRERPLTAVFVGGTSGIGEYAVRALTSTHGTQGKGLRAYIVGRNQTTADKTIEYCNSVCPDGHFVFVKANDLRLLRDVDTVCTEIIKRENIHADDKTHGPRIDMLCLTQGELTFKGREETDEGLDYSMSLLFYSRMRFIMKLLPLLQASPSQAHIVSVFAAGSEKKLVPDDLSLRKPANSGYFNRSSHSSFMTTMCMEKLAAEYPDKLAFVYQYPGLVVTANFSSPTLPWFVKIGWAILGPLLKLLYVTPNDDSGQITLSLLCSPRYPAKTPDSGARTEAKSITPASSTTGVVGGGTYSVGRHGQVNDITKAYGQIPDRAAFREKVWSHVMALFEAVDAGKRFTD